jgi:hypothetical protein
MVAFENMKSFLELLKIKHYSKKHWCDIASWGMAKALHTIVMQAMMLALDKVNVFAMFCVKLLQLKTSFNFQSMHIPFKT